MSRTDLLLKFLKLTCAVLRLLAGFGQLILLGVDLFLNDLKLLLSIARLGLRSFDLRRDIAGQILQFQRLPLRGLGLILGSGQLVLDFRDLRERSLRLLASFGKFKKMPTLLAPPQAVESDTEEQRDQLDFGHLQIGFGIALIDGKNFPLPHAVAGIHKDEFSGASAGVQRAIR